jgi:hypothetical protein
LISRKITFSILEGKIYFKKNFLEDVQICSKKKHKAPESNHSHLIILTMAWHVVNDFIILALFGDALDMRCGGVKWD